MTTQRQPRRSKAAGAPQPRAEAELPFVSVLVPVRNEAGFIGRCLQALAEQDYPRERYEVIVLDGESTDATEFEVQQAAERHGLTVYVATNHKRTAAAGFNLGLTMAKGEVIVKVDGHTRVDRGFIAAGVRALQESGADAVGGPIETVGYGRTGRAIALAMSSPFGIGDAAFRYSQREQWTDSVPFGAYRREVFQRVGTLAEDVGSGEDDEFNYRLREAGGRILLTPAVRSVYYCRTSLRALARQYWGYGLAKAEVLYRHPRRLRPRHLVPSALVLALTLGPLLGIWERRFLLVPAAAGLAYAAANLLATGRIAAKGHRREAPLLPAAFATIHFAAGFGFLAGAARVLLRRVRDAPRH